MSSIVIGYDGSSQSEDAIVLGRAIAEATDADPVVVAAATWPVYLMGPEDLGRAVHAHLDPLLEVAADRLSGLRVKTEALHTRSVAEELGRVAERQGAASIVIGSSHHGTLGRIALGSVGTSLIHGAPCAVAVAQRGLAEEPERRILRIGVAFDGSPEAEAALQTGIGFARSTNAALTLLTVAEVPVYALTPPPAVYSAAELSDIEVAQKQRTLELGLARVPKNMPVDGRLLKGPPGRLIPDVSSEFDLLLMGSRGYGPIGRTFLGGVATHVVHASRCPVMVLPRGTATDPFGLDRAEHQLGNAA